MVKSARKIVTTKFRFFVLKSISQPFLIFWISNFHQMSYFMPYFNNLMKNLGVTYDNFLSQNLAKSKFTDSRCYLHDSQRSTGHNSVFFASQIFNEHLETWYILIIWWKFCFWVRYDKCIFFVLVDISSVFEFFDLKCASNV